MNQATHAQKMTDRFRELIEASGDSLAEEHFDELRLIIESGLDAVLIENMESIAHKLESLAKQIKHDAES